MSDIKKSPEPKPGTIDAALFDIGKVMKDSNISTKPVQPVPGSGSPRPKNGFNRMSKKEVNKLNHKRPPKRDRKGADKSGQNKAPQKPVVCATQPSNTLATFRSGFGEGKESDANESGHNVRVTLPTDCGRPVNKGTQQHDNAVQPVVEPTAPPAEEESKADVESNYPKVVEPAKDLDDVRQQPVVSPPEITVPVPDLPRTEEIKPRGDSGETKKPKPIYDPKLKEVVLYYTTGVRTRLLILLIIAIVVSLTLLETYIYMEFGWIFCLWFALTLSFCIFLYFYFMHAFVIRHMPRIYLLCCGTGRFVSHVYHSRNADLVDIRQTSRNWFGLPKMYINTLEDYHTGSYVQISNELLERMTSKYPMLKPGEHTVSLLMAMVTEEDYYKTEFGHTVALHTALYRCQILLSAVSLVSISGLKPTIMTV